MKRGHAATIATVALLLLVNWPARSADAVGRQVVWVAAENVDRTLKVDVGGRQILHRYRTPGGPHNITVAPDGIVTVSLYGAQHIAIIRESAVDRVFLGGRPHDVKFAERRIVVANEGSSEIQLIRFDGKLT